MTERSCDKAFTPLSDECSACLATVATAILIIWLVTNSCTAASGARPAPHKPSGSHIDYIWANTGEDKVTREELRVATGRAVANTIWDGEVIKLFSGRNEVVSFNLILEAVSQAASDVEVTLSELTAPNGHKITSKEAAGEQLWNFFGRNIELFYIRYLEIKGVSTLTYNYWISEDNERHLPKRFRRPTNEEGEGSGTWLDRPDHNTFYPDIAAPLELHTPFTVQAGTNQSIWADIYVPKGTPPGVYRGMILISERGELTRRLPVELRVRNFVLPDLPTARTMLYINAQEINQRYLGTRSPANAVRQRQSRKIVDRHYQLAHRHKISLIDAYIPIDRMGYVWSDRLNGDLFTAKQGYDGIGVGVGNNVFSIGTYSTWPWYNSPKSVFWTAADRWVKYFEDLKLGTPTDFFLYLIDESSDFATVEKWSRWMDSNPGIGRQLQTMATIDFPDAIKHTPALDIPASVPNLSMRGSSPKGAAAWKQAFEMFSKSPKKKVFMYNGSRPLSGTFAIEDDGVSPRQLGWVQYKKKIDRWFVWEGTYYVNFQHQMGPTNVFRSAHTFGRRERVDEALGETGLNYDNGNGVLFYPGSDAVFSEESYDLLGPMASLRMKYWRRGLQDHDYLTMAARVDPDRVRQLVQGLVPRVLWEIDAPQQGGRGVRRGNISWPTDPDRWEEARLELADIIEQASGHR